MTSKTVRGRTLLVVLGVALVTAALVGVAGLYVLRSELRAAAVAVNQERAARLAASVRGAVSEGAGGLAELAAAPSVQAMRPGPLGQSLDLGLRIQPLFHSVYVYDAAGEVVLRRYRGGNDEDEDRSASLAEKSDEVFKAAAQATLADGKPRTLSLRRHRGGDLFLPCLSAVTVDGSVVGLLSGAVSAGGDGFEAMVEGLAPGETGWVALLDGTGEILAATSAAPGKPGETLELRGTDLRAASALPDLGLRAIVGISQGEAFAALPKALGRLLLATLAALLFGGAFGVVLATRITGPLGDLVAGIRRVEEGVLGHRVRVDGEDEVAEVSRAFNRLAETLARHEILEGIWTEIEGEASPEDVPASPEAEGLKSRTDG